MPRVAVLLSVLSIIACGGSQTTALEHSASVVETNVPEAPEAPAETPAPTAASENGPMPGSFGGKQWGFVEASSMNGQLVFIRRFSSKEPPHFGHHGETSEQPEFVAFDRFTGEERRVDELISVSARRWFLVLDQRRLFLVDAETGTWETLVDVDMDPDDNVCLPPRQANFSPHGKRVAWVDSGATSLVVRDLETGEKWSVAAKGALWRGWPDDEGKGAVLAEVGDVSKGWPMQQTSCACRWCNRFAASYGTYGWAGPAFTLEHVKEDGSREAGSPPDSDEPIHGATDQGCLLEAAETRRDGLSRGAWQWRCSK